MADGIGCKCMARYEGECACDDVDWTPQETIDLRAERDLFKKDYLEQVRLHNMTLDELKKADDELNEFAECIAVCKGLEAENQKLREALTVIINAAPGSAHRIARMALG